MIVRLLVAFGAGFASVITPCVLPLVPGYLATVSAVDAERLGQRGVARRVTVASLPFFAGFIRHHQLFIEVDRIKTRQQIGAGNWKG